VLPRRAVRPRLSSAQRPYSTNRPSAWLASSRTIWTPASGRAPFTPASARSRSPAPSWRRSISRPRTCRTGSDDTRGTSTRARRTPRV